MNCSPLLEHSTLAAVLLLRREHVLFHCALLADQLLQSGEQCLQRHLRPLGPVLKGPVTNEDARLKASLLSANGVYDGKERNTNLHVLLRRVLLVE